MAEARKAQQKQGNWTKIANNLADSSDWEYVAGEVKIQLNKDIEPGFVMYMWEEYLKLAHKKGKPSIKGAEFKSRLYNTRRLFPMVLALDYVAFDELIKFINKQFIELDKLDNKMNIKKFNDYYDEVGSQPSQLVVNQVNGQSTFQSTRSQPSSQLVSQRLVNQQKKVDLTKKINSLKSFICRVKNGKQTASQGVLERNEEELKNLRNQLKLVNQVNHQVNGQSTKSTFQSTRSQLVVNGGDRGGYIPDLNEKNTERERECVTRAREDELTSQPVSQPTTPTPFFEKGQNDETPEQAKPAQNSFNRAEFMRQFKEMYDMVMYFDDRMKKYMSSNDVNKLKDGLQIALNLAIFATIPLANLEKELQNTSFKAQISKVKEKVGNLITLLDENTGDRFNDRHLPFMEKKEKKKQYLDEILNEARKNQKCTMMILYQFLLQFYNKKNKNGYSFDCPTFEDLANYVKDHGTNYYNKLIWDRIGEMRAKIKELQPQATEQQQEPTGDIGELIDAIFTSQSEQQQVVLNC